MAEDRIKIVKGKPNNCQTHTLLEPNISICNWENLGSIDPKTERCTVDSLDCPASKTIEVIQAAPAQQGQPASPLAMTDSAALAFCSAVRLVDATAEAPATAAGSGLAMTTSCPK